MVKKTSNSSDQPAITSGKTAFAMLETVKRLGRPIPYSPDRPDAGLLGLCAQADRLIYMQLELMAADRSDSCNSLLDKIDVRLGRVKKEILGYRPVSQEGRQALARTTLGIHTEFFETGKFDPHELDHDLLSHLLLSLAA